MCEKSKNRIAVKIACLSLFAIVISYLSSNANFSVSSEKSVLKYWCSFTDWITSDRDKAPAEDVIFINVANDKQLVKIADEFGIPIGNAAITDRTKLKSLLSLIQSSADYQYVLLDVFFEEGSQTDADSALFSIIGDMDRIVIPKHKDGSIAAAAPVEKAAFADYNTSINENDFTKYQLFQKDGPSVPLRMYSDLTGRTVKRKGLWYADRSALSRKVVFPKMYVRIDSPYRSDGQKAYLNMGTDILEFADEQDWAAFFSGKFIVIGSLTKGDIHSTYAGEIPGCLILYNVFLSLMKGQHKIPFVLIIVYFLIFFGMAYMLLKGKGGTSQPWAWVWAKLFVLYSAILTIICIFVFTIWGQAHDIFITSTFFSVVDLAIRRMKAKK